MNAAQAKRMAEEAVEQHRRLRLPFMHDEKILSAHVDWLHRELLLATALLAALECIERMRLHHHSHTEDRNRRIDDCNAFDAKLAGLGGGAE
jgi:hypothetical protein